MAEKVSLKKSMQQGVEDGLLDYYDIMVIGRTGMGKSTTVDKFLIANLTGSQFSKGEAIPTPDLQNRKLVCGDMTMWLISDKDFDLERVSVRLKNLVFFRALENPHKEVNASHETYMNIYQSTSQCELLSNESTKVRVLDVPGFFGHEAAGNAKDLDDRVQATKEFDLGMMRKVLRIKNTHNLNFNRIIYFLPDRGSLKRTSQNLIQEIGIMEKYFGRPIFDSMVVVATLSSDAYELIDDEKKNLFSEAKHEVTKRHLQEALQDVFNSKDVPEPSVIFISLFDTCEEVLVKVQTAEVRQERIRLELKSSICVRCGVKIVQEGKEDSDAVYCTSPDQSVGIVQNETTCHPMMVPKYSKIVKILGGVAHLVTFRRFVGKWPSFETMDEKCISCKLAPNTRGCLKIGSKFVAGREEVTVSHSTSVIEPLQIEVDEHDDVIPPPASPGGGSSVAQGTFFGEHGGSYYVYPDGRQIFKQEQTTVDFFNTDIKG